MADDSAGPIAVTGATGFLGHHVQRQLLAAGYAVRCLTRNGAANLHPGVQQQTTDLGSIPSLQAALTGVAAVIYLAGSVRGRTYEDFLPANVDGVANTAHVLAERLPATPLLLMSSLAATAPELSHYARSKAAGERALRASGHGHWTILRPPAVYGEGDKEMRSTFKAMHLGLVPKTGPAQQRIPFIEATDLAAAVLAWLRRPQACNQETYTIDDGSPDGYDWAAIARLVAPPRHLSIPVPYPLLHTLGSVNLALSKALGYAPMLTPGKARELSHVGWSCSNRAFTEATGWRPQVGLGAGVQKLFANAGAGNAGH